MESKSTYLGTVQDVTGTSVSVSLGNEALSGLTYVDGEGYRIGQIGSFVKIPIGYIELFGIVTQVGASAVPQTQQTNQPYGNRWLNIQLLGEGQRNGKFERGLSQYPTIGDEVHLVSENDLKKIYGQPDKPYFVKVGHISGAESIAALIDINKLITRHSAVVGTTGSGKSTTVASLINALANPKIYPASRIVILDIHGEYGQALRDNSNVYKINADRSLGENELFLPFWALSFEELVEICFGGFSNEKDKTIVLERILEKKKNSLINFPKDGADLDNLNVDSPIPFSLCHLWYELYIETLGKYYRSRPGQPTDNLAFETDSENNELRGNPISGTPPIFKKINTNNANGDLVGHLPDTLNIGQQLHSLGSKLRVPRFDFIFKPGAWLPGENGQVEKDLDELLQGWIGSEKPITILDLSGVPTAVLNLIIGVLLRILYDALFWSRKLSEGGKNRPLLIVMEEAHNYLNDNFSGLASQTVQRIAKEGRKYGIGAMIVSQRPSEINSTILSQCGSFFALRLSNSTDRSHITSAVTDNLEGLTNMLPILRTGEAIILGESVKLPMRVLIDAPDKDKRPDSFDPVVYDEKPPFDSTSPGGWGIKRNVSKEDYEDIMRVWRSQNPNHPNIIKSDKMKITNVTSSTIASIGYDENSQTLEVSFLSGSSYQYFDVPKHVAEEFIENPPEGSHGKYLSSNIKGTYRYTKV
ncbi:MAG: DUF853 family protein [Bacteroidetes bacterium]|nr:MAG: DUF853 family protein [Bacteroidota bacterium]